MTELNIINDKNLHYQLFDNKEDSSLFTSNTEENQIIGYNIGQNLDEFLTNCYYFFRHKSMKNIIISNITNILSLSFTLILSCILFFLDWTIIKDCKLDNFSCSKQIINISFNSLSSFSKLIFIFYIIIFFLYILWSLLSIFLLVPKMKKIKYFFCNKLKISENELLFTNWTNILEKFENYQDKVNFIYKRRIYIKHTKEMAIQRIMRKDNVFIAIFDKDLFNINNMSNLKINLFSSKLMEWSLRLIFINEIKPIINKNFLYDPQKLKRRIYIVGILNFIIFPFSFIYSIIYFFLDNAVHIHTEPKEFMSYTWTNYAYWTFKNYNELNHVTNQRLFLTLPHVIKFMEQFKSIEIDSINRFLIFILGSLVSFMVILGFINEAILSITIFDRNLWWYIAILTGLITILKNNLHNLHFNLNPNENLPEIKNMLGHKIKQHEDNNNYDIYLLLTKYIKFKFITLILEIISVFSTPILLIFYISKKSNDISQFLKSNLIKNEQLGYLIDLDNNNDSEKLKQSILNFNKYYNIKNNKNIENI